MVSRKGMFSELKKKLSTTFAVSCILFDANIEEIGWIM